MKQNSCHMVTTLGKKGKGQTSTRWSDELREVVGTDWILKAKNQTNWKGLVKTFAHNWVVEGVEHP